MDFWTVFTAWNISGYLHRYECRPGAFNANAFELSDVFFAFTITSPNTVLQKVLSKVNGKEVWFTKPYDGFSLFVWIKWLTLKCTQPNVIVLKTPKWTFSPYNYIDWPF